MTPNGTSRLKAASVVFGVLLVAVTIGYLYVFRTGGDVRFKDRGLENAVLEAVSNEHDDARQNSLFREDLERITRLDASGCGIETIEGIERLSNLQVLDLSGNPLSSIEPLAELPKLVELSLRNTGISDIQPLAHLVRLQVLDLRETDLSESGLEPLQDLNALEELNLRETGVRDVTVLAELQNLRYLNIHSNDAVSSLEPITGLTRLRTLIMRNVPVHDQIHVLKDLHNLRRLNIRNTGVSDLRVLASLMSRGALQDGPSGTVMADVDIRDNPVEASVDEGPFGYDVLLPYWENISQRKPEKLPRTPTREVLINEAVTSNGTVVTDADGDYPDWIELFNPGERPVDIGGFFLSDNPDETDPWEIPQGTIIGPGEYLMVWASGKDSDGSVDELHSSFALSADGTTIVLSRPGAGARIDIVEVPPIPRDTSFGRNTQGEFVHFIDPTPGDSNEGAREYLSVSFSHNGGFYDKPFELILTCPDDSADIYYTFNGSVPDPVENSEHTYLYDGPISINEDGPVPERRPEQTADIPTTIPKAEFWEWQPPEGELSTGTVVRAIAYKNRPRSNVYSESYFIDSEIRNVFPLAAVSIIADPDNLFSHEKGIYVPGRVYEENVDYEGRWMQHPANYYERWEVPAHIEFFEPDGFRGFAVDGGIRIHGSWSRSHPLKSLRLYARKDYDRRNYFSYPVFPEACRRNGHDTISRYKRLLLRSGQSLFGSFLQDGVSHAHIHPYVEVDLLRFRPVVHFINGEYWGLKNLRERFDRFYLEANYGIDPENAVILGGPLGFEPSLEHGRPEDRRDFHDLQNYIFNNNMADDKLYQSVTEQMDIDSFIDYNVVRIYSGDTDGVTKHVAMWRLRDGNEGAGISGVDGRWRFHTWDLDNALRIVDNDSMTFYANDRAPEEHRRIQAEKQRNQEEDELTEVDSSKIMNVYHPQYTRLFVDLLQNRMFRRKFLNRFADLLNSVYRPEVYSETIEKAAAIIEPEIRRHIRRWGYPLSFRYWRSQVELNLEFARRRPDIQRRHIIEYFVQRYDEPSSTASVTIGPLGPGGTVRINSLTINGDLPGTAAVPEWEGTYFSGIPVTFEAVPDDGYRFSRWKGDVPSDTRFSEKINLLPDGDLTVTAVFEKR